MKTKNLLNNPGRWWSVNFFKLGRMMQSEWIISPSCMISSMAGQSSTTNCSNLERNWVIELLKTYFNLGHAYADEILSSAKLPFGAIPSQIHIKFHKRWILKFSRVGKTVAVRSFRSTAASILGHKNYNLIKVLKNYYLIKVFNLSTAYYVSIWLKCKIFGLVVLKPET